MVNISGSKEIHIKWTFSKKISVPLSLRDSQQIATHSNINRFWKLTLLNLARCLPHQRNLQRTSTTERRRYWSRTCSWILCRYVFRTELIVSLKLSNVWVFVPLKFGMWWPMNQLNKNPNIAYLETSYQLWVCKDGEFYGKWLFTYNNWINCIPNYKRNY